MKKLEVKNLHCSYAEKKALNDINFYVNENEIFSIIGPANAGKTTLLQCLNRMIELVPKASVSGSIYLDAESIQAHEASWLRRRIGMVAPLPVGLPMSIKDNVTYAPRMAGINDKTALEEIMVDSLTKASLWDEVKDRLDHVATKLSGGQQQRLTIARALSHAPDILCLDEFSIAIDPVTTARIEETLKELKTQMTIILVTNINSQAKRLSDRTAMMFAGEMTDIEKTDAFFAGSVKNEITLNFIEGKLG
ncbi:MAG: phosphate ABC transporter ATP-binding protein [Bacteriovoracaceae bacterium]